MSNSIPKPTRHIPFRLALYSVALFAMMGLHLPFWPVWLEARGLSPEKIGFLVALGYFVRTFSSPLVSFLADVSGDRRAPIRWLALASLLGFALFGLTGNFIGITIVTVLTLGALSPLVPLKESLIMGYVTLKGYDYGRIRMWGSLAFIVFSMAGGVVLARFGTDGIWVAIVVLSALGAAAAWWLPPDPRKGEGRATAALKPATMWTLVTNPVFFLFLLATSAIMASHAVYYTFGTLNWLRLGYTDSFIGILWALGVVVEIVLFAFSSFVIKHISPTKLIVLGAAAGIVRWSFTGLDPHWGWLIPLQCLHALTFGATHLGAMHFIVRAVPIQLAATAQGMFAATAGGLVMGGIILAAGPLYESLGALSYMAMAVLCVFGLVVALGLHRLWNGKAINVRLTDDPATQETAS